MRITTLAIALALVGCALPPPPAGSGSDDDDDRPDASAGDDDDDPIPDAGPRPDARRPGQNQLTHSTSTLVVPGNSIACNNDDESTAENSYYRVFALADFDISGDFVVDAVELGVDEANGGNNASQTVDVRLYTLAGALATNNLTQLATTTLTVGNVAATILRAELDDVNVPAGSTLVVEVRSPDGGDGNDAFYIGSNPGGQTGPSYIRAAECGDDEPRDLAQIGYPNMHIVMTVFGKS